jgi:hypothetical protein
MNEYKLSSEERCLLLRALWAKERELESQLQLRIELDSPIDIIEDYRKQLELVKNLDDKFLQWSI